LAEAWAARSSVRRKERSFILKAGQEAEKESAMKRAEKNKEARRGRDVGYLC
jgi:hypothetical protein